MSSMYDSKPTLRTLPGGGLAAMIADQDAIEHYIKHCIVEQEMDPDEVLRLLEEHIYVLAWCQSHTSIA